MNFVTKSLKYRNIEIDWQKKYGANAPKVGTLAPNIKLYDVSGKYRVKLSDYRGQIPVALVFGSFT